MKQHHLSACCENFFHNVLFALILIICSIPADTLDTHTFKKTSPDFLYIDNSITAQGRNFSNRVYLTFINNIKFDINNIIVTISEERRLNSLIIRFTVNGTWNYQLKLPESDKESDLACEDVVTFLRTTSALLRTENN